MRTPEGLKREKAREKIRLRKERVLPAIWKMENFPRMEKCVLSTLVAEMDTMGGCDCGLEFLAKKSCYNVGNTHLGIKQLVAWGLVTQSTTIVGERKTKIINLDLIIEASSHSNPVLWLENQKRLNQAG